MILGPAVWSGSLPLPQVKKLDCTRVRPIIGYTDITDTDTDNRYRYRFDFNYIGIGIGIGLKSELLIGICIGLI